MGFIKQVFFVLLLLICSLGHVDAQVRQNATQQQTTADTYTNHAVNVGETVYSLATKYKTSVSEIYRLNPGSEAGVKAGQVLIIPLVSSSSSNITSRTVKHVIEAKETLFSVSQKYEISVEELKAANPGLDESSFRVGREIIIPEMHFVPNDINLAVPSEYKVEKQDTLYSISKKYNCTVDEILELNPTIKEFGLREGAIIKIPVGNNDKIVTTDYDSSLYTNTREFDNLPTAYQYQDNIVRVAVLLPFIKGSKNVSQAKVAEYYEGFLLAVQRMKERGMNAEIYTFDIGSDNDTKRLQSILSTYELNGLDLIIGGVSDKQVQLLSRFSKKTGTNYVVPFSNKNTGVEYNKNIFQVANSHSSQYSQIAKAFVKKFNDCNVIFLTEEGSDKNRMDFVKVLQKELKDANVSYKVTPTTPSITSDLNLVIDKNKKNIIVPTSSSLSSLRRVLPVLALLKKDDVKFSLFGYPDWQSYTNLINDLHGFDSYLYSMFYLDEKEPDVLLFTDKYKKWYNKNLVLSYPRYAHMGYDTGILFLTALQKEGRFFAPKLNSLRVHTLQSALYFEPISDSGGRINTGIYFVNLKPDGSVEKNEINR